MTVWRWAVLIAACFLAACGSRSEPQNQRWAVLLFDDLSADTSHRWLRRAIPEQLGRQFRRSGRLVTIVSQPDPQAARASAIAAGAVEIVRGNYNFSSGRLQIQVHVETAGANQARAFERGGSGDAVALIAELARDIDPEALPSAVKSSEALQRFAEALDARDAPSSLQLFAKAIELDPDFGAAYLGYSNLAAATGQTAAALPLLKQALARTTLKDNVDSSQIAVELAALSGDAAALGTALEAQSRLLAADAQSWARTSEAWLRAGRPAQAVQALERALALKPDTSDYLNQLGYARAYQGDVKGAVDALQRYRKLRPRDPNAFDSLGDVHYYNNHYSEAAAFYREAYKVAPDFYNGISLLKAAYATLWTGDVEAASRLFEEYRRDRESRRDPALAVVEAEWLHFSGRRAEALRLLEKRAPAFEGAAAAKAWSLAALWSGDPRYARQASGSPNAALAIFVTLPQAPAPEWLTRAQRMFPNAPAAGVTPLVGTALLKGGHFADALSWIERWQKIAAGQPGDFTGVLKAWVLIETGRAAEARDLVRYTPLIPATGMAPLAYLIYPRLFHLRARAAEAGGNTSEARRLDELFRRLSG